MSNNVNDDANKPLTPSNFQPGGSTSERMSGSGGDGSDQPLSASAFEPLNTTRPERTKPSWPWVLAVVAGVVLVSCLFFLLTARSLEVYVDAVGEPNIAIDGFSIALGNRYLIRPGRYPVSVNVEGYTPWQEVVDVGDDASQRIEIIPAILPGKVSIQSTPPGASVVLNGESLGLTPLDDLRLPAGSHELTISLSRYQAYGAIIEVTGRGTRQTFATELAPDWAEIGLSSLPTNADIFVDGEQVGSTDSTIEVLAGDHELILRKVGYRDHSLSLSVTASVPQVIDPVALIPADGVLSLTSIPTAATVSLDGEFAGRTPVTLELSPGDQHRIQLSKLGYARKTVSLALEKGAFQEQQITLDPQLGDVVISIQPADAQVLVNGVIQGNGSQTLTLPAFEHRLEIKRSGYASERRRVTPRPGLEQVINVALLTEAEARKAALTPEITTALGQTLVLIDPVADPMNEFSMGASRREPGRRSNEVEHTVRLERAFYIATTETTNAQFRLFLEGHDSGQIEGNSLNREHQPVTQISWQQAARFCNWLSAREGLPLFYRDNQGIINGYNPSSTGYRLPSESEWSFAARVEGTGYRKFAWGNNFPPTTAVVNVADNTSALVTGRILNGYADGHIVSAPVASFPANHRGIFDMGGNVAEWVHDVYVIPSANAETATDPLGALNGDNYTVRGASWALSRLSELRLTYRDYGAAGRDDLGFRIARYAE